LVDVNNKERKMKTKTVTIITILTIAALLTYTSCALLKGGLRTATDWADIACDLMGTAENAPVTVEELCTPDQDLDGFSLVEFCSVHKPLSPFIRRLLAVSGDECVSYGADPEVLGIGGE
jgi:hypothetical protein